MTTFEDVRAVADAVLYEGYALYPYRADDAKNLVRWQFGVLVPVPVAGADPSERSGMTARLLLEGRAPRLVVRLRFLQVRRRDVERRDGAGWTGVPRLETGQTTYLPFDEAVPREHDVRAALADLLERPREVEVVAPQESEVECIPGGRLVRGALAVRARVRVSAERMPGPYGVSRVRVDVENATGWTGSLPADRSEALRRSLVAAHLLVRVDEGSLLSMTEPPEWASVLAEESPSEGVWPVRVGAPGTDDMVLCSPIILPDHPEVAPESPVAFFDSTEMDEMLSLRALTLTAAEKRAVRGTDARLAALLEDVEGLPEDVMERLHGAVRSMTRSARVADSRSAGNPAPGSGGAASGVGRTPAGAAEDGDSGQVEVSGVAVGPGSRVLLRPGRRRADAQDLFLAGRTALVVRVEHDVDGRTHLALVLDDEGLDVALVHGRFLFFAPDEVEPLGVGT